MSEAQTGFLEQRKDLRLGHRNAFPCSHSPVPSSTCAVCLTSSSNLALAGFNCCMDRINICFLVGATSPQSSQGREYFFFLLENLLMDAACELRSLLMASPLGIRLKRVFVRARNLWNVYRTSQTRALFLLFLSVTKHLTRSSLREKGFISVHSSREYNLPWKRRHGGRTGRRVKRRRGVAYCTSSAVCTQGETGSRAWLENLITYFV